MVLVANHALLVFPPSMAVVAVPMVSLAAEMVVDGNLRVNNTPHEASGAA